MKTPILFLSVIILLFSSCTGQAQQKATPAKTLTNKDFNWTITIPENFEQVPAEEWAKMQNKGQDALEQTIDGKIDNQAKTIFVFRSDRFHYMESNKQPFDPAVDGNHSESCHLVDSLLYQTFVTQMAGARIDTLTTSESIDGLIFHCYNITIHLPGGKDKLSMKMYNHLFSKKELTVTIMYMEELKGRVMLAAWRSSKFGKQSN
jgi:hypothetical protein